MQIAAILTVAAEESSRRAFSLVGKARPESGRSYATVEVLGASLLDRTLHKLRALQTLPPRVLRGRHVSDQVLPSRSTRSGSFLDAWEKAISDYVNAGVETLLLIRVGTYADVDYSQLLRFHAETRSPLTQVYGNDASLDIAVVDARLLRNTDDLIRRALSNLIPQQKRFLYTGYVNRLRHRPDLYQWMNDGLQGRCELRPVGTEIRKGVWCADGAALDQTVRINEAAFIGKDSRIAAGCALNGVSSIERGCHIDCGTVIEDALVLQDTYVGVALDVKRSVVSNGNIFSLDRNVEVSVSDPRLLGQRTRSIVSFAGVASLLIGQAQAGD